MKAVSLIIFVALLGALVTLLMFFRSRENGRIQGRTVSQWLKVLGTAKPEENPLALKQLVTGEEPRRFVFEVSVSYDLLQLKHGEIGVRRLALFADGKLVSLADRASNGNCILTWEAVYDPPGTHRLCSQLLLGDRSGWRVLEAMEPVASICSSNALQLDEFWNSFSSSHGGTLYAKLPAAVASYHLQLLDSQGRDIRTFQGTASNGVIEEHWDLTDRRGITVTDDSVSAIFRVLMPGSSAQVLTQRLYRSSP